jgi:hypothetical protein
MSPLGILNQHEYVTMRFRSVVTYWTRTHGVIGLSSGQVIFFSVSCNHHVVILYYTKNHYQCFIFSENLKPYIFIWPYFKWR